MHQVTFAGRLGGDAETKTIPSGESVTEYSLAVDVYKGGNKDTMWVKCSQWGKRGVTLAPMLTKGKQVTVSGRLSVRAYLSKAGEAKPDVGCDVQEITLQGGGEPRASNGATAPRDMPERMSPSELKPHDFDDPIPF